MMKVRYAFAISLCGATLLLLSATMSTTREATVDSIASTRTVEQSISPSASSVPRLPSGFRQSVVVTGISQATSMEFSPDGRLFVADQGGTVWVVEDGTLLETPFLTIPAVTFQREGGLLGITLDPEFESNGYLYAFYTLELGEPGLTNRVSRFTSSAEDANVADPNSELVLLDAIPGSPLHNGGGLDFGIDGKLYVSTGDAAQHESSQWLGSLVGKLLRIDPSSYPDIVPPDNPFVVTPRARGEVWALGLRNPFNLAVDPESGRIYINDPGASVWEEINLGAPGANYGWPECAGPCSDASFDDPIYAYDHREDGGCAVTGGTFYRADQFPAEYAGDYFFTDYCSNWIKRLTPDNTAMEFAARTSGRKVDLDVGPDGSLYYLTQNVGIYKISYGNSEPSIEIVDPDIDDSGTVGFSDFLPMLRGFGEREGGEGWDPAVDLDVNGAVTLRDVLLLLSSFGLEWPPRSVPVGRRLAFYVRGTDLDGDKLEYSADIPEGACFDGMLSDGRPLGSCRPQEFVWTPSAAQSGSYQANFTVTDGSDGDSTMLPIVVRDSP